MYMSGSVEAKKMMPIYSELSKVGSVSSAPADWLAVTTVFASHYRVGVTVFPCRLAVVDCLWYTLPLMWQEKDSS